MQKVGIITDSASDINFLTYNKEYIKVLPMKIIYSDGEYKDGLDITPDEVYAKLTHEIPKTSLPSGEDIINSFQYFKDNGFTDVVGVLISSNLSGTSNQVQNIAEDFPELNFIKFDTRDLTLSEGLMAKRAGDLAAEGKTAEEIINHLKVYRTKLNTYFILDTLEYLIKGGRIGKVSGTIGQLLNLKPIIHVGDDGIYHSIYKVRGKVQGKQKLIDMLTEFVKSSKFNIYVMHGGSEEEGKKFFESIKNLNLANIMNLSFGQITPSLGVHTGAGLVGFVTEALE